MRVRVRAGGHDLDDAVQIELRGGARRLGSGPLGGLRKLRSFRLERGATKILRARIRVPRGAEGYEGRRARISLALRTELTGAMQ